MGNYDETAITVDAGNPKVITRRSSKSPRAVLNNNKTSRSVMFAVTADGECLAPRLSSKRTSWMDSGHLSVTGTHRSRDGSTCAFLTTGSKQSSHRGQFFTK